MTNLMWKCIAIAGIWSPVTLLAVSGDMVAVFSMAIMSLCATGMVTLP